MGAWARDSPPEYVQRWRDGSDGERKTARALRPLERDGWNVVHDVVGERGNRDHIAVGPGGTFLIDSKAPSGLISIEGDFMLARLS